jgi:hypothetical protein
VGQSREKWGIKQYLGGSASVRDENYQDKVISQKAERLKSHFVRKYVRIPG